MKWPCGFFVVPTFFGALNKKRMLGFLFGALATLWMASPAHAWGGLNDSTEPGSVLVFHKFIRGTVPPFAKTEIEISVTCPVGATCATSGQVVKLHGHWVCPGGTAMGCNEVDFNLMTTVNGSIKFDPENFETLTNTDTVPQPPCPRGFLILWVVDDSGNPIKFDGLIGDAVIRDSNGTDAANFDVLYFRAYNAVPIQADPSLNTLDFTDLDSSGNHTGTLQFDGSGSHYQEVTGTIYGTVKYDTLLPTVEKTFLTLLTLDVLSGRLNNPTFVDLNFYNEKEVLKSAHTAFFCWEEVAVTSIDNTLTSTLFGNKGLVQSTGAQKQAFLGVGDNTGPVTLLGIVETVDNTLEDSYAYSLFNDSQPLPTTYVPH
jgi:hypothetical protein